jgi:hypothetical protein
VTLKYNNIGQLKWIQQYDSLNYLSSITLDDSSNVYVTGQYGFNLSTIKYNSSGVLIWDKTYTGSKYWNSIFDIITDRFGNVYITGNSHGDKITTIKYNTNGNLLWVALDSPAGGFSTSYITLDENGNVYVAARGYDTASKFVCRTIKYNNTGVKKWERDYNGNFIQGQAEPKDIKYDPNGFIYVLSYTSNNNNGNGDFAIVKYDTLGNQVWTIMIFPKL